MNGNVSVGTEKEKEPRRRKARKEEGGEMYTDLREIGDVTLIYSNFLS